MLRDKFDIKQIDELSKLLSNFSKAAIVCHVGPDGDAIGSSLCLCHILNALGKDATVVTPNAAASLLSFMPGFQQIIVASYHPDKAEKAISEADCIFCLDFNDLKRVEKVAQLIEKSNAKRIVIDHHLNPCISSDVLISHPEISSTCALLYQVVCELGLERFVNTDAAICCMVGMMTDTGNFSYNSNDPKLYDIVSALLKKGVDKDDIYQRVFNTNSLSRVRIMGYAQCDKMQIFAEHRAALISLSREELNRFDYKDGDTEALVNIPLSIPGVVYSVYLREDEPGFVKVSMRSKGEFSVKDICESHFEGGGHRNAAGGEMHCSIDMAVDRMLTVMDEYDRFLPNN